MNNNNKQTNILRHNSEINFNKYSSDDKLHHFGLSKKSDDLKGIFGDVKVILLNLKKFLFFSLFVWAVALCD